LRRRYVAMAYFLSGIGAFGRGLTGRPRFFISASSRSSRTSRGRLCSRRCSCELGAAAGDPAGDGLSVGGGALPSVDPLPQSGNFIFEPTSMQFYEMSASSLGSAISWVGDVRDGATRSDGSGSV